MKTFILIITEIIFGYCIVITILYHLEKPKDPCEYQMICTDEGYYISDDDRPVGFIPAGNSALDSIMIDDNQ
jgi:hypothetical protein